MRLLRSLFLAFCLVPLIPLTSAGMLRADPPCLYNIRYPRVPPLEICGETIVTFPHVDGIASITALALGPDGALYFARPATRQIVRIMPDSSGFITAAMPPEQAQVFAANLTEMPN